MENHDRLSDGSCPRARADSFSGRTMTGPAKCRNGLANRWMDPAKRVSAAQGRSQQIMRQQKEP
jgi:hypothetical protein